MERPETHYVRSGEIAIAYQVHGNGPHDILFVGGTASNVETIWQIPEAAELFERLGRFARVIRFDRRDTGLSDPIKDDLTLEAHAADALAVIVPPPPAGHSCWARLTGRVRSQPLRRRSPSESLA